MPWCQTCSRFFNPSSVAPDGTCTACGSFIAEPNSQTDDAKVPWHFWVMVAALVIYLGWRLVQTIIWLATGDWPT